MADFDAIMATNVRAVVSLNGLALPHLEATKGNIVNISRSANPSQPASLMSPGCGAVWRG